MIGRERPERFRNIPASFETLVWGLGWLGRLFERHFGFTAAPPQLVVSSPDSNSKKPATHRSVSTISIGLAISGEKGLLRHILGERPVPEEPVDNVSNPGFISDDQLFECPFITVEIPGQHVSVRVHRRPSIPRAALPPAGPTNETPPGRVLFQEPAKIREP